MAVRKGFEPLIRDERIHAFQACSFSHSDISPLFNGTGAIIVVFFTFTSFFIFFLMSQILMCGFNELDYSSAF